MNPFAFLRKCWGGGDGPPSLAELVRLDHELKVYLDARSKELADEAERVHHLLRSRQLQDALERGQALLDETAELTTLHRIAELLGAFLIRPLPDVRTPTYYISALFLAGAVNRLLPAEKMALLSGAQLGEHIFTIDTGVPLRATASAVHVSPTAESRAATLNYMADADSAPEVIIHTHPGDGAGAVWPSSIDTGTLARLQKDGFPIIGLVACKGGFFRAYSDERPFQLHVVGEGVEVLDAGTHLYRVSPELLATAEKLDAFVSPLAVRAV